MGFVVRAWCRLRSSFQSRRSAHRVSAAPSCTAILFTLLFSTAHADFLRPPSGPSGELPKFDPTCTVFSVDGPHLEYWVSYSGPFIGPGIDFDFFACPLGRTILHPIFCLDISLICPGDQGPNTERLCFHAGGDSNGDLEIFPSDYRKPKARRGTFSAPELPSEISPDRFREFWEWYEARQQELFGGRKYCIWGSGDNNSLNCGSYLLLLLAKLLGKTPAEVRDMIPSVDQCTHFSWDLYEDPFILDLETLLLMPEPSGPPGIDSTEPTQCLAMMGLTAAEDLAVASMTLDRQ
jgi:hypothetical protein